MKYALSGLVRYRGREMSPAMAKLAGCSPNAPNILDSGGCRHGVQDGELQAGLV